MQKRLEKQSQAKPIKIAPKPNAPHALELVTQLMAIPGKTGEEKLVVEFITRKLREAGASAAAIQCDNAHRRSPVHGNTGNLVFRLPGTFRGARRMFSAHMDTVPLCVGVRPVRKGNVIRPADAHTALGADDRAGCAVVLGTALEILEQKLPHPPLTFVWFAQEENGVHGSHFASKGLWGNPKMAFNFDGGSPFKLTIGATSASRMTIEVKGVASHAGIAPEYGVSAISIAGLAIADLVRNGWHGNVSKGTKQGTCNIGVISGGDATNVVTDKVVLQVEARSHNSGFRKRIIGEIKRAFEQATKRVKSADKKKGRFLLEDRLSYEAYLQNKNDPCVKMAETAVKAIGKEPVLTISNGGLDANWITKLGVPTVSLGCGQVNAHMLSEALDITFYQEACRIALDLATCQDY